MDGSVGFFTRSSGRDLMSHIGTSQERRSFLGQCRATMGSLNQTDTSSKNDCLRKNLGDSGQMTIQTSCRPPESPCRIRMAGMPNLPQVSYPFPNGSGPNYFKTESVKTASDVNLTSWKWFELLQNCQYSWIFVGV